jgi:hypothetical protein
MLVNIGHVPQKFGTGVSAMNTSDWHFFHFVFYDIVSCHTATENPTATIRPNSGVREKGFLFIGLLFYDNSTT